MQSSFRLSKGTTKAAWQNDAMRGAIHRRWLYVVLYVMPWLPLVTHCAARTPALTSAQLADVGRAEALMRDGCYACLQEAAGIYARLIQSGARKTPERVLSGAFDTTVLLAVREKELGLPADARLARAQELGELLYAASAGASVTTEGVGLVLLEAAKAVPGEAGGLDAEERQQKEERKRAPAPLLSTGYDLAAFYVAMAIDCKQSGHSIESTIPPLLRYRILLCAGGSQPAIQALAKMREEDPRWAEISFFEGKYEMGSPARAADPERAAALLTQASAAFPDSIAIRLMLANAHDLNGNAAAALDAFDRVLAAKPTHVDARLGRLTSLSYLSRVNEAITAATAIIDTGTWNVGDAYYWRAWNRYQARQLDEAWADVRQAMSLVSNTAVYALAGSIAYARKDLDTSIAHFNRAFEIDPSNCLAVWSAGLVHNDRADWPAAAGTFAKAAACFATAAATARKELAGLEKAALAPAVKERRQASTRKRLESAEDLREQATLNAARSIMRAWMPAVRWPIAPPWGPDIMRRD
jgi:tetratricopeptide (TPR) repeat protein